MGPEYFWMGGMWIFPFVMMGGLVFIIYLIFGRGNHGIIKNPESALEILKKRYAQGEISKEEFETMKQDII